MQYQKRYVNNLDIFLSYVLSINTIFLTKYTILGLNGSCSVHEWVGPFKSETVNFKMTSVCGHVMTLDFIGKYNNWDKVDPVRLNIMISSLLIFCYPLGDN